MAKFNTSTVTARSRSARGGTPLTASASPTAVTHEGGSTFAYDAQTELFTLLTTTFITEKSFYTTGDEQVARVRELVTQITAADASADKAVSGAWFAGFAKWLRTEANIRTGAIVLACEVVKARQAVNAPGFSRDVVNGACDRGDEPGELLGYWLAQFGKTIPIAVKRGLADAVVRLYSEYSTLRYDTSSHAIRFGDVIDIVNPRTNARAAAGVPNHPLYKHLIDRRHAYNTSEIPEALTTLRARAALEEVPVERRRALLGDTDRFKAAAMSWEALAGWLQGPMDAKAWETIVPTMGYMALLRNLRNFDEQGMSKAVAAAVAARLADPAQVAKSRQLPFRFWSAYKSVSNDRWKVALGDALEASCQNIPDTLGGRTLVLVDTSGSMGGRVSENSSVTMHEIAGLFGVAMATKFGVSNVDLFGFADFAYEHKLKRGASIMTQVNEFYRTNGRAGYGTQIEASLRQAYKNHDRVVLLSDMQTWGGPYAGRAGEFIPKHVPFYAFNLRGYGTTAVGAGENRFQLAGLSDKTFQWMETAEKGQMAGWPWETAAA